MENCTYCGKEIAEVNHDFTVISHDGYEPLPNCSPECQENLCREAEDRDGKKLTDINGNTEL